MSKFKLVRIGVVTLALVGCSTTEYTYVPTAPVGSTGAGIPSLEAAPLRGDVAVTSSGVEELHGMATLRVRLMVMNRDTTAWGIDTRAQWADIPGVGRVRASYASTNVAATPYIRVDPGTQAAIDLYFPLADGAADNEHIRDFTVSWQIQAGKALVGQHTLFQRYTLEEPWRVG
jgi:hypothetical protein